MTSNERKRKNAAMATIRASKPISMRFDTMQIPQVHGHPIAGVTGIGHGLTARIAKEFLKIFAFFAVKRGSLRATA